MSNLYNIRTYYIGDSLDSLNLAKSIEHYCSDFEQLHQRLSNKQLISMTGGIKIRDSPRGTVLYVATTLLLSVNTISYFLGYRKVPADSSGKPILKKGEEAAKKGDPVLIVIYDGRPGAEIQCMEKIHPRMKDVHPEMMDFFCISYNPSIFEEWTKRGERRQGSLKSGFVCPFYIPLTVFFETACHQYRDKYRNTYIRLLDSIAAKVDKKVRLMHDNYVFSGNVDPSSILVDFNGSVLKDVYIVNTGFFLENQNIDVIKQIVVNSCVKACTKYISGKQFDERILKSDYLNYPDGAARLLDYVKILNKSEVDANREAAYQSIIKGRELTDGQQITRNMYYAANATKDIGDDELLYRYDIREDSSTLLMGNNDNFMDTMKIKLSQINRSSFQFNYPQFIFLGNYQRKTDFHLIDDVGLANTIYCCATASTMGLYSLIPSDPLALSTRTIVRQLLTSVGPENRYYKRLKKYFSFLNKEWLLNYIKLWDVANRIYNNNDYRTLKDAFDDMERPILQEEFKKNAYLERWSVDEINDIINRDNLSLKGYLFYFAIKGNQDAVLSDMTDRIKDTVYIEFDVWNSTKFTYHLYGGSDLEILYPTISHPERLIGYLYFLIKR